MTGFSLYTHVIPQRCPEFSLRGLDGDQRVCSEPPEVFVGSWRAGNAPSGGGALPQQLMSPVTSDPCGGAQQADLR